MISAFLNKALQGKEFIFIKQIILGEIGIDTLVLGIQIKQRVGNNNPQENKKTVIFEDTTEETISTDSTMIYKTQNKLLHMYDQVVKGENTEIVKEQSETI